MSPAAVPSAGVSRALQPRLRFRLPRRAPSITSGCLIFNGLRWPSCRHRSIPAKGDEADLPSPPPLPHSAIPKVMGSLHAASCCLLPTATPAPGADGVCAGQGGMAEPDAWVQTSQGAAWWAQCKPLTLRKEIVGSLEMAPWRGPEREMGGDGTGSKAARRGGKGTLFTAFHNTKTRDDWHNHKGRPKITAKSDSSELGVVSPWDSQPQPAQKRNE